MTGELIGGAGASGALEAFEEHQRVRGLSPNTIRRRRQSLRVLAAFALPVSLLEVTEDLIWEWLGAYEMLETRHAYQGDARAFYRWARKRGLVLLDPTEDMPTIRQPKHLPRPMHEEDLNLAIVTARDPRLRLVLMLGAYAGLRIAEIAALRADDCTKDWIVVRQGKGAKDGTVPTHPELWAMIQAHGVRRGFMFPVPGGHISPATIGQWVRKHFDAIGLEGITLHQARHRFGTKVAEAARGNMLVVRDLMRHSTVAVTEGYVAFDSSRLREYVDGLPVAHRDEVADLRRRRERGSA